MRELPFKVGDEIKNYKEMCKLLDEKERAGSSRASQLKRWREYFLWDNIGHRFIITKVINNLYPTHDNNRVGQGIKPHSEELQSILLHFLKAHNEKYNSYWLTVSMKGLINLTQIFRHEFHNIPKSEEYTDKISKQFQVKGKFVQDFYNRVYTTTTSDIKTALKQLEQKSIIAVEEVYMGRPSECIEQGLPTSHLAKLQEELNSLRLNETFLSYINHFGVVSDERHKANNEQIEKYNLRPLEPFETNAFLGLRDRKLSEFGYASLHEVYKENHSKSFFQSLNNDLRKTMKMNYVFKGYRIIFLPHIIEQSEIYKQFTLPKNVLENLHNIFSQGFQENIEGNYKNRLNKSLSKNNHIPMFMFEANAEVCDNDYYEMTPIDRLLLSIDNLDEVVKEMLNYFMKKK